MRKNAGTSKKFCGEVLQKSFMGKFSEKFYRKFYGKVLRESFSEKFYRKFYGEILRKDFTGEMGSRVWIETWKVVDPSQLQ